MFELTPLVTAVIPCFNHEFWVEDAINSIVHQTYENKRLIVIDDGSTDNSWEKIKSLVEIKQDIDTGNAEPIKLHRGVTKEKEIPVIIAKFSKSFGPSSSRNYGVETGWDGTDVFAFLDSDDIYLPDKIQRSIEIYCEHPEIIGAVYSDFTTLNVVNNQLYRQYKEGFSRERLLQECIVNNDSLVSKKALALVGKYDEEMRTCEDYDLWMRISEHFLICHIPESLVTIRVGKHSSTDKVSKEVWNNNWRRVFNKLSARNNGKIV